MCIRIMVVGGNFMHSAYISKDILLYSYILFNIILIAILLT